MGLTTSITLYQNSQILESENLIVEYIEDYLVSLYSTALVFQDSQFFRHSLDNKYKIATNAFEAMNGSNLTNYNYCKITTTEVVNESSRSYTCYYFIRKITEVSPGAVELTLHMDVINTYRAGTNFTISDRTNIKREHQDRYALDALSGKWYCRYIDFYPEGINPTLYRDSNTEIFEDATTEVAGNYYLIYRNSLEDAEDTNNVVDCYLVADEPITYSYTPLSPTITATQLEEGMYYYFFADSSNFQGVELGTHSYINQIGTMGMIRCIRNGAFILAYVMRYQYGYNVNPPYDNTPSDYMEVHVLQSITLTAGDKYYRSRNYYDTRQNAYTNSTEFSVSLTDVTGQSLAFADINRTDSRIIKIIKIPYAPTSDIALGQNDTITFDSSVWEFDENEQLLKLKDINNDFLNESIEVDDLFGIVGDISITDPKITDLRAVEGYDPKIYHSEFYQIKFLYDSFSININAEDCYIANDEAIIIGFKMTKTINSRFMFSFDEYGLVRSKQDFPTALVVQRNNEEVLYNSPYINYLRSGFNYDVKAKNRTEFGTWFNTAMGITGGLLSVAFGSKTLGVGLIASSLTSLGNAITSTINAEQNLEAKIAQLKWQANSVSGADDVDLMSHYAHNKLLRYIYKVSPRMKELLNDLFYYTGYIANKMDVPNVSTRKWFNFLSCELKFDQVKNIPDDCLKELCDKYLGGVTFLHRNKLSPTSQYYTWDFERKRANWESIMFS